MFEVTMGKTEYLSASNLAFNVDVISYKSKNGVTDMRTPSRICGGYYINNILREPSVGVAQTLKYLSDAGKLKKPIVIFDQIHIVRELNNIEKKNREALERALKQNLSEIEAQIGDVFEQVLNFKEAIGLIKDKNKFKGMLPLEVESVAFIEMCDTEGDYILSQEAELIGTWEAINKNKFNIYRLW